MSNLNVPKLISNTFFVVGFVIGVASLLNYYDVYANQGLYPLLETLVGKYREVVQAAFGFLDAPLRALVRFVAGLFDVSIEVQPYWKDVFVPIGLYFASSARATHGDRRRAYRTSLFVVGIFVALSFSVCLATFGAELSPGPALATLVAGVVFYELLAFGLLLLLVEAEQRQSSPEFLRWLLERPVTSIVSGLLATAITRLASDANAAAFSLVFFIFLLGLRNMALAIFFAVENRGGWPGKFKDRLFRSRSWILGVLVVVTIIIATLGIAWGG